MQVEETKSEGLSREFAITIPGDDIEGRVSARLTEIAATVKMPGFRPGKVPMPLLRKQYGPSVIGEVLSLRSTRQPVEFSRLSVNHLTTQICLSGESISRPTLP